MRDDNMVLGMYPMAKASLLLALCVFALVANSLLAYLGCVAVFLVIACVAGVLAGYARTLLRTVAVLGFFMFLIISITTEGESLIAHILVFDVYAEGVERAVLLVARIALLCGGFMLLSRIASPREISFILSRLGLGSVGVYVVESTFQMIPEMRRRLTVIMEAQQCRGLSFEGNALVRLRRTIPALMPLVLSSFYTTEEKTLVLEARGISVPGRKRRLYAPRRTALDLVIAWGGLAFSVALVLWRFLYA